MIAANDTILVGNPGGQIILIDVGDPFHPRVIGNLPGIFAASSITLSDSILLVLAADGLGGFQVFDLQDPENPELLISLPEITGHIWDTGVWAGSSKALVLSEQTISVVDFSDRDNITLFDVGSLLPFSLIWDVTWIGTKAYVSGYDWTQSRLFGIELSDPATPVITDDVIFKGLLAAGNSRLYRSHLTSGVVAHDLSPGLPQTTVGSADGNAEQMVVDGDFGYVADGNGGLQILDVSNPILPVPISRLSLPGYAEDLVVTDSLAYIAADEAGLVIVNVQDPEEPVILSSTAFQDYAYDLDVSGSTAVVTTRGTMNATYLIEIVGVTDPMNPVHLATVQIERDLTVSSGSNGIAIDGDVAWVAAAGKLSGIDIAEPSEPQILGDLEILPNPGSQGLRDVALLDGLALVAGPGSLYVVDISDPTNPTMHSTLGPGGPHVNTFGNVAVIGSPLTTVIDFSDPDEPKTRSMPRIREGWGSSISNGVLYSSAAPFIDVFTLECRPPIAGFDYRKSGQNYWFTNTSEFYFADITWDFGDGSEPSTELNPSHRFPSTGEFTVTLQISGDQGSDSFSKVVTVAEVSEIFMDGFEAGTFDDWSTVVP